MMIMGAPQPGKSQVSEAPGLASCVPNSQVLVVKYRGLSTVEGGFRLLGVLAANSDGKKQSREAMAGTEGAFGLDVAAITHDINRKKLSEEDAPNNWRLARVNAAGGTMEVTPYAFISSMASGDARIYVFLKSKYRNGGGKDWGSRYIYHGAEIRLLAGSGSWSENDGARFRQAVTQGVAAAV
jgi:hypothetical protein